MTETILNTLPIEHPLRNQPLAGMYSRNEGTKTWIEITPAYGIAKSKFNDLDLNSWRKTEFMAKGNDE